MQNIVSYSSGKNIRNKLQRYKADNKIFYKSWNDTDKYVIMGLLQT
jgi:hypothetical protein